MLIRTTTPFLRHAALTYLRPASRAVVTGCIIACSIAVVVVGGSVSPPVASHALQPVAHALAQAYVLWCSMLAGAAPYIAAGAICGAVLDLLRSRLQNFSAASWLRCLPPFAAAVFSGCDCGLPAIAGALRQSPVAVCGFALEWAACCNPVGLLCTAAIFGPRMLLVRVCGGLAAASLTALCWGVVHPYRANRAGVSMNPRHSPSVNALLEHSAAGMRNVCLSAAAAAIVIVVAPRDMGAHSSIALAALVGALVSPCSSSDPVLARAIFHSAQQQIVFMMAAQTLDVRQLLLLRSNFGYAATALAAAAAGIATCSACWMAALLHA